MPLSTSPTESGDAGRGRRRQALAIALATLGALTALAAATWLWMWPSAGAVKAPPERVARLDCPPPAAPADAPHPGMVWVPGGSFDFGDTVYPEEQPIRRASVQGFWMDRTEVTNAEFARFVQATGYVTVAERPVDATRHPGLPAAMQQPGAVVFSQPREIRGYGDPSQWWRYVPGANWRHPGGPGTGLQGRESFPVVAVTWEDAQAYARWRGRMLPTEAQWEWAARGGQARAGQDRDQPAQANTWQGVFPLQNEGEDGFTGLAPVGCFAPNAHGLHDLLGNAWELTADRWQPRHGEAPDPMAEAMTMAQRAPGAGMHVIKGGSYLCAPNYCMRYRSGSRQPQEDDLATTHVGFRTILMAPPP